MNRIATVSALRCCLTRRRYSGRLRCSPTRSRKAAYTTTVLWRRPQRPRHAARPASVLAERSPSSGVHLAMWPIRPGTIAALRRQHEAASSPGYGSASTILRHLVDDLIRPLPNDLVQKSYGTLKPF